VLGSGASKGQQSIDDRGLAPPPVIPPSGHLWRAPTSIRLQSRSRFFAKGHLWPRGTASFARALSPCGRPRARLLGPGQSDFGRIYVPSGKDALGSIHWNVDQKNTTHFQTSTRFFATRFFQMPARGRGRKSEGAKKHHPFPDGVFFCDGVSPKKSLIKIAKRTTSA
jgi:hypothetical protein